MSKGVWQATGFQQAGSEPLVSAMPTSPLNAVDIVVDGHEAAEDDDAGNENAVDGAEDDDMTEF